jgi:phosphoglycolate phosphatase
MSPLTSPVGTLKSVVFDFDGTLADSYAAITATVNHVRAIHQLPPLSLPEVKRFVGYGPAHLLAHTVPAVDLPSDLSRYKAHHPSVLRSGTHLLPGVRETLPRLRTAGYHLAVCSNKLKPFTCELLDFLNVAGFFEAVIGPEDAPRLKPAPDMLLAALRQLNTTPSEALYIGDMVVDIQTARAAGVAVWTIPTGSDAIEALRSASPDRMLESFGEITRVLGSDGASRGLHPTP